MLGRGQADGGRRGRSREFEITARQCDLCAACLEPRDRIALGRHPRGVELRKRVLEHGSRAIEVS